MHMTHCCFMGNHTFIQVWNHIVTVVFLFIAVFCRLILWNETSHVVCVGALNFFTSSLNTLCNKTMDDTLLTVKQYEAARWDMLPVRLTTMMMILRGCQVSCVTCLSDDVDDIERLPGEICYLSVWRWWWWYWEAARWDLLPVCLTMMMILRGSQVRSVTCLSDEDDDIDRLPGEICYLSVWRWWWYWEAPRWDLLPVCLMKMMTLTGCQVRHFTCLSDDDGDSDNDIERLPGEMFYLSVWQWRW